MNKISTYFIIFFLAINCSAALAQNNKTTAAITNERDSNIFYHTIERGNGLLHCYNVWCKGKRHL